MPPDPAEIRDAQLAAINAERDRRLALGFDYDFGDKRGVHRINTTDQDMKGWNEVTLMAQTALNLGQPETEISIKTGTGRITVTAMEWQSVLMAAAEVRQPLFNASFDLQEAETLPDDIKSDSLWLRPTALK